MNCSRLLFAALIISSIFYSCDSDNPAGPKGGSDLSITFSINRSQSWFPEDLGGVEKECMIYAGIERNGEPVTDAKVVVNGIELSFESVFLERYIAQIEYSDITPGQKVKCSITIDGKTAEEEVVMPGDVTPSSDGSSVSWKHEGNGDFIYIQEIQPDGLLSRETTYMSSEEKGDLTSPAAIPASAYPKTGTAYLLTTVVRNSKYNAFSSLSAESAIITASDLVSARVAR